MFTYKTDTYTGDKKALYEAINEGNETAWLKSAQSVSHDVAVKSLTYGSSACCPMPKAALYCFEHEDMKGFKLRTSPYHYIHNMLKHFDTKRAASVATMTFSLDELEQFLNWCIEIGNFERFLSIACQVEIKWQRMGQYWLETAYSLSGNGWACGVTTFLESKGIRVSPGFNTNLKWHSSIESNHGDLTRTTLNELIIEGQELNQRIPILNHRTAYVSAIGYVLATENTKDAQTLVSGEIRKHYRELQQDVLLFTAAFPKDILSSFLEWIEDDFKLSSTTAIKGTDTIVTITPHKMVPDESSLALSHPFEELKGNI